MFQLCDQLVVQYPATNLDVSTASEVQSNRCERVNYCDVLSNSGLCTSLALKLSRGLGMVPLDYSTLLHARIYLFIYLYLSIYLFVQCFTYDCLFVWYGYNGKENAWKQRGLFHISEVMGLFLKCCTHCYNYGKNMRHLDISQYIVALLPSFAGTKVAVG